MADDLVKRLLRVSGWLFDTGQTGYELDTVEEAAHRIEELEKTNADLMQTLQQEYERSRQYQTALSNITKMTMCMATSYNDLAQKQKDLAIDALAKDI